MWLCKGVLNHAWSWAKPKCVATLSYIVQFLKYVQSGDGFGFSDVVVSFMFNASPPMKFCTSPLRKNGAWSLMLIVIWMQTFLGSGVASILVHSCDKVKWHCGEMQNNIVLQNFYLHLSNNNHLYIHHNLCSFSFLILFKILHVFYSLSISP